MNKHRFFIPILLICFLFTTISCDKEWDAPEYQVPEYAGKTPNKTIADIKALHTSGSYQLDSICHYSDKFLVEAYVISSDEGGNCYKYLTVQDETGGIEIAIDQTGLYNIYPIGQKVIIDCRGLIVGDYHGKYQIGWIYEGAVGRINSIFLDRYLYRDGMPGEPPAPILVTGENELTTDNVNKLVKIDGCKFAADLDGLTLATNDLTIDRAITINGATIIVRTSNYAKFRNIVIDADKEYCLTGILSVYNSEYQLTLRTKEDVQFAEDKLVKEMFFDNNSLSTGGWTVAPSTSTTQWAFQNFEGDNFMFHNATSNNCDDWLISPVINLETTENISLFLDHKMNIEGSLQEYYQVYYSTNINATTFNESDWHLFTPNLSTFPSDVFGLSNGLSLNSISQNNFKIAIRLQQK